MLLNIFLKFYLFFFFEYMLNVRRVCSCIVPNIELTSFEIFPIFFNLTFFFYFSRCIPFIFENKILSLLVIRNQPQSKYKYRNQLK